MIRARESLDRYAHAAHDILDQIQQDPAADVANVNWALAYLGDRAGSTRVPLELKMGYDKEEAARDALVKSRPAVDACWGAA